MGARNWKEVRFADDSSQQPSSESTAKKEERLVSALRLDRRTDPGQDCSKEKSIFPYSSTLLAIQSFVSRSLENQRQVSRREEEKNLKDGKKGKLAVVKASPPELQRRGMKHHSTSSAGRACVEPGRYDNHEDCHDVSSQTLSPLPESDESLPAHPSPASPPPRVLQSANILDLVSPPLLVNSERCWDEPESLALKPVPFAGGFVYQGAWAAEDDSESFTPLYAL